jgi:hypothetical protein
MKRSTSDMVRWLTPQEVGQMAGGFTAEFIRLEIKAGALLEVRVMEKMFEPLFTVTAAHLAAFAVVERVLTHGWEYSRKGWPWRHVVSQLVIFTVAWTTIVCAVCALWVWL